MSSRNNQNPNRAPADDPLDHFDRLEPRVLLSAIEFADLDELFDARLIQRLDTLNEDVAAVAAAGDLDDDEIADYVLGLRDGDGRTFLRAVSSATGETIWDSPAFDADTLGQFTAIGDLDDDGIADLAIGVPHEDFGSPLSSSFIEDAGAVVILHGGPTGLTQVQVWDQSMLGETREAGDIVQPLRSGVLDTNDIAGDLFKIFTEL